MSIHREPHRRKQPPLIVRRLSPNPTSSIASLPPAAVLPRPTPWHLGPGETRFWANALSFDLWASVSELSSFGSPSRPIATFLNINLTATKLGTHPAGWEQSYLNVEVRTEMHGYRVRYTTLRVPKDNAPTSVHPTALISNAADVITIELNTGYRTDSGEVKLVW